jgi:hypothetical protein
MRRRLHIVILLLCALPALVANTIALAIEDGEYTFTVAFAEWGGQSLGATCKVIIKGNSVLVLHDGNPTLSGRAGEVIDKGFLMRHKATGKWIIGKTEKDKLAPEIGGCSDGPSIIDLKKRIFWLC